MKLIIIILIITLILNRNLIREKHSQFPKASYLINHIFQNFNWINLLVRKAIYNFLYHTYTCKCVRYLDMKPVMVQSGVAVWPDSDQTSTKFCP